MSSSNASSLASVGSTQLSFKEVQNIYNEITGKSENLSFSGQEPYHVHFQDLEQANHVCMQCIQSLSVIAVNTSITAYHSNGEKQVFSSFDRFKLYNTGNSAPLENVNLSYSFLLADEPNPAKSYKVSINVTSQCTIQEKSNLDPINGIGRLQMLLYLAPLRCKIDYVDYVVAKTFQASIDEWIKGLTVGKSFRGIKFLQRYSHWIPRLSSTTSSSLFLIFAALQLDKTLPLSNADLLAKGSLLASISITLLFLGFTLGKFMENAIDKNSALSQIHINKGDEKINKRFADKKTSSNLRFVLGIAATIALNIASNYLSAKIF